MKRIRIPVLFLAAAVLVTLTACGSQSPPNTSDSGQKQPGQTVSSKDPEKAPEDMFPAELQETWIHFDTVGGGEAVTRLTLMEDGTAQMPVLSEIGELLALCVGTWSAENKILTLTMTPDPTLDPFFPADWETIGGEYHYRIAENGWLYLSDLGNPCPIIPYMSDMTVSFESSADFAEREERESELLGAVLQYYQVEYGEEYPGWAEVDSRNVDGTVSIRLCEDMGDHIATAAWYTVDLATFIGWDDMAGGEIDFSLYCD